MPTRRATSARRPRVYGRGRSIIVQTMINSVFQIVKELHATEQGQRGGFKLHNAKTPVMRYVHQPGFLKNPREVREFAAPPGLKLGSYRISFPSKLWVGR